MTVPLPSPAAPADTRPLPSHVRVAVVGSGFAGLGAAIELLRAGIDDLVVLERGPDVGGTWRDNSYPGCACDVPSHLYSFSFAPNPDWSHSFSPQPEIQAYLQRVARDFGVLPLTRFDCELREARWDDAEQLWHVQTSRGELTAQFLVAGAGPLSEPALPDLPGLDSFAGTAFHSAAWRHDHDLTGRRVAVIGTGASAIQFVPYVQRHAAQFTLFQRTAPWVLPRRDREISGLERTVYRHIPVAQKATRAGIYLTRESWVLGFTGAVPIMKLAERMALKHLNKQVPDPALRAKLTPHFRLGCKRVLLSNDYYPALSQPNAEVVTDRIVEVLPQAVVSEDSAGNRREHPVDTIIYGTGFKATDPPIAHRVRGRDGRTLAEHWEGTGMSALRGTTVAGFPNLFFLVGPNTGLGHTSIVFVIESQVRYLLDAVRQMDSRGLAAIEPRAEVQEAHNAALQQDLEGTVWNAGGCASWYLDKRGRNTTLWPTFTVTMRQQLRHCDLGEYVAYPRLRRPGGPPVELPREAPAEVGVEATEVRA